MWNRESSGEPGSRQTSSANYLVYLFLFSATFIVVLPYMGSILVSRPSKKADIVQEKPKLGTYNKKTYSSPPASYPTISSSDYMMTRVYGSEGKCDALEVLVLDLQKVVQVEREKTLHLENEVRVLQISENFLKERIQYLEDKSWESRKDSYASSMEVLLQNALVYDGRKDGVDTIVHELLKMVQAEKDRTSSLEKEIRIMQKSEAILIERIDKLESQFSVLCKQSNLCDSKN
ncbi:hypothetical protein GOP47_0012039 [Adiantum capillus-veneris]|uniref:Uncharacterized protein n=1 Tax=Adiantum capillus-veneris TaxID=13818 RepID=A0A9D4UUB6_ADICA|nr:hypothetical protein GOP47_0030994 [Adiantum capillus-veneris]KAI5074026.1 hypothetical protein GOP47_0012039 [Adiantum capillus-veneris]